MTRDTLVALGVAFLAGVAVGVEYMNYAAPQTAVTLATPCLPKSDSAGEVSGKSAVAAPIYCLSTQDGMPLRMMIRHCPDGTPQYRWCQHTCWYGNTERRNSL